MKVTDAIPAIDAALTKLGQSILSDKTERLFCVGKNIRLCESEVEVELMFRWAADYDEAIEKRLKED